MPDGSSKLLECSYCLGKYAHAKTCTYAQANYGSDSTAALLVERGKTHGDFTDHARITSKLKDVLLDEIGARVARGQQPLTLPQREALDMITHKIGRIIAGDANHQDHWDDIAGYAKLVSERCAQPVTNQKVTNEPDHWAEPQPVRMVPRHPVGVAWGREDPGDAA